MLCDDLMFSSQVTATGRALNIPVMVARTSASAAKKAAEAPPQCVIVDLHNTGLVLPELLAELKKTTSPRVIGFGSHVNVELLKAAREAGCDLVMPRSQFHKLLERDLPSWVAVESGGTASS
jgi:DNA-binding NarL/FixJ family response regulator